MMKFSIYLNRRVFVMRSFIFSLKTKYFSMHSVTILNDSFRVILIGSQIIILRKHNFLHELMSMISFQLLDPDKDISKLNIIYYCLSQFLKIL